MDLRSIRFKLTAWYFLWLAAVLLLFGLGARFAMQASFQEAVDHDLELRLGDVRQFLTDESEPNQAALLDELQEQAMLGLGGGLVELWDGKNRILFRSARLGPERWASKGPPPDGEGVVYVSAGSGKLATRSASQAMSIRGASYIARVYESVYELGESVERFDRLLLISTPVLLLLASLGGYAVSKRALAPVDRMTQDARSIGIGNLAARLPVPKAHDELQRLAETLNDMLERIDREVERMGQFTADASHELRTPLTLIHTAAEFSLRADRPQEELLEAMRKILRETGRTTRLVDDLLTLAREDELRLAPAELGEIARTALEQVRPLAESKRVALALKVADGPVVVNADEDAFTRLILILLDNAVKYTGEDGRVEIAVSRAEVSVTDTGIGIAAEDLPKIWDRFWRADKVRSRSAGGSGLGLSIARSIADRHGARLEARSEVGKGSRFTLRIAGGE